MMTFGQADMRDDQRHGGEPDACHERMVSPRFAKALRDNPQSPHDWLAIAEQLSDDYERRFCLRRAQDTR